MKKKIILAIIIFLLAIALPSVLNLYVDWLWFQNLQLENIFSTILKAKLLTGFVSGLIIFIVFYSSLLLFRKLSAQRPILINVNRGSHIDAIDIQEKVNKAILPISILLGILGGIVIAPLWETILKYLNQVPFGITDPVFEKDIAYFVFNIPFYEILIGISFFILFISFVLAIILYLSQGALVFKNRSSLETNLKSNFVSVSKEAKTHLSLLISLWLIVFALNIYYIKIPSLVYSHTGPFLGASYTDIHILLPALYTLFAVAIFGALISLITIKKTGIKGIAGAFGLLILVQIVGSGVLPSLVQGFIVKPNELAKETEYIKNHIDYTQKAWGLDKIQKKEITSESSLSQKDIRDNSATIKNIRLWDRGPLLDTFGQIQEIRTYYDFVSVDDDRYELEGEYRQVLLSPRELNPNMLPQKNFINEKLTFTHGMGLTLAPVNEVTSEGLPVLFTKDLPPQTEYGEISITRPEIYYGEFPSDFVFVKTEANEFDYPAGEENVYATYEGVGGVQINSFLNKVVFAIHFNSLKILLSNDITNDSRVMYHREITERIKRVFPYLMLDNDPYIVINDGRLTWMQDAYTTTSKYPYSEYKINNDSYSFKRINYMRNSVKITVDAYGGTIKAYISDANDPIIQTYSNIFANIFEPIENMPKSLIPHLRYPEDIFAHQSELYEIYHMDQAQIFYNKEDQWEIPRLSSNTSGSETVGPMMRHLIMKLPEEKEAEFILMLPFTPRQKDNMSAWMVARSDGESYGELIVYSFPKQSLVFGPKQIVNRINQDSDISAQISLWDQSGSEVIQGNLLVIPINESILYVRPLYLRAEGGRIPELKRVIVAYNNQIAMEETLDQALSKIFGGNTSTTKTYQPTTNNDQKELIKQANQHFESAQSALRRGNWAQYGEEMKQLDTILKKLK